MPLPVAGDEREGGQATPSSENTGTLALAVASPSTELHRLAEIRFQLQALPQNTKGLGEFVRTKLLRSQSLLTDSPEGRAHLSALAAVRQQPQDSDARLALEDQRAEARRNLEEGVQAFRAEYKEAINSAREGIVLLQQLALDVPRQREQARQDRIGYAYHEGYKQAVGAFRKQCHLLLHQSEFVSRRWVLECQRRAGLDQSELRSSAVAAEMIVERPLAASVDDPNAQLVWFPNPAGPKPPVLEHANEEELALVPVEVEDDAEAAPATMPAPVLRLACRSRAPPKEETALQAPDEPDHARLREEAIRAERERLTPERVQKIRQAYERLATQRDWPKLPGDGLPDGLKARVAWFFFANARFREALEAKQRAAARSAVTDKLARQREQCPRCQRESFATSCFCRQEAACAWDTACAKHIALSVAEEVKIEEELSSEWAEEAINAAIRAWQKDLDLAAKARRDSQARQQAEEAESDRRCEVEVQAREHLRLETRRCPKCLDADECMGGMCSVHEENFRALCVAMSSGGSDKPMPAPLRAPAPQC